MKTKILIIGLTALLAAGCATNSITPMGNDTYMINRGGWPHMNGFAVESECYRDAYRFCTNRGLIMVPVSTTMIDGEVFAHNASCNLVFKAVASTNAPADTYMISQTVFVGERQPQQRNAFQQQWLAALRQQQQDNQNALQQSAAESQRTVENLELQQASHPFVLPPGQPIMPNIGLMSQPNLMDGLFQQQPLIQQQEPNLPSAWEMQHSMRTGNVKFAPDGVWHEYRTTSGVTFWKLDQ